MAACKKMWRQMASELFELQQSVTDGGFGEDQFWRGRFLFELLAQMRDVDAKIMRLLD